MGQMVKLTVVCVLSLMMATSSLSASADFPKEESPPSPVAGSKQKAKPGLGALDLVRPAGRVAFKAAKLGGRAALALSKVDKPGRRATWIRRAALRGAGKLSWAAARTAGKAAIGAAKAAKPKLFRGWFKKKPVEPPMP